MTLARAVARPGTFVGLLGSVFLLLGGIGSSWLPDAYRFLPPVHALRAMGELAGGVLLGVGLVLHCVAFLLLRPRGEAPPAAAAPVILGLWSLPLLVAPPLLSRDVYAYLDQGWLVCHGLDPYTTGMGTTGMFQDLVDDFWRGETVMYPPLTLLVQAAVVAIGQGHVIRTMLVMRLPVLLSLGVVAALLPSVTRRAGGDGPRALWLALLSPVTTVHLIGGGHNDALMIAGMVTVVWLAGALRPTGLAFAAAAVAAGVTAALKQPGLLAAVAAAELAWPSRRHLRRFGRAGLAVAIAGVTFVVVSLLSGLGFGWLWATGGPMKAYTQAPACLLRIIAKSVLPVPEHLIYNVLTAVGLFLTGLLLAWLWWRRRDGPLGLLAWGFLAYLACGASLQPWYFGYASAFLAAAHVSRRWGAVLTGWFAWVLLAHCVAETSHLSTLRSCGCALPVALLAGWWAHRFWPRLCFG